MNQQLRIDQVTPSQLALISRQTEAVRAQILETKRPPLNGFSAFGMRTDIPAFAETFTSYMTDTTGSALIGTGYETDVPSVGMGISSHTRNVRYLLCQYSWTLWQLLRAAEQGTPLPTGMPMRARKVIEETHNDLIWSGNAAHGLYGVVNQPGIPRVPVAEPIGSGASSEAALLTAILDVVDSVESNTNQATVATRVLMAQANYSYLANTRCANSDRSLLEWLIASRQAIGRSMEFHSVRELESKGPSSENLMIAYNLDPSVQGYEVPAGQVFEQLAPQFSGYQQTTYCYGATGGFNTEYPLEMIVGIIPA
tara:strand:- start:179 stop:1111 length:933 start_codon:yes stop_codon:yes gene_type:complete